MRHSSPAIARSARRARSPWRPLPGSSRIASEGIASDGSREAQLRVGPLCFYSIVYSVAGLTAVRRASRPSSSVAKRVQPPLPYQACLLYTSDAADDLLCVDLGG